MAKPDRFLDADERELARPRAARPPGGGAAVRRLDVWSSETIRRYPTPLARLECQAPELATSDARPRPATGRSTPSSSAPPPGRFAAC
jgi:hypothetical protein